MAMMGAVFGLIGAVVSAAGTIAAGKAQKEAAYFEATQLEFKGQEARAAEQRKGLEAKREAEAVLSKQQSLAAASGLGATDPTIAYLEGDTAERARYIRGMFDYSGAEQRAGLYAQAKGRRMTGDAALAGARASAAGTILSGFGGMFENYGGGGYSSSSGSSGGSYHGYV